MSDKLTKPQIETFVNLVKTGLDSWRQAGEILVQMVEADPNVYSAIMRDNSFITFEMLLAFEKIGRHQIYPPLILDDSSAAKRLLQLPYEQQERFFKEPIEVVILDDGKEFKTQRKHLKELSKSEAIQVFDVSEVRSVEKQRSYIKTHNPIGRPKAKAKDTLVGTYLIKISPSGSASIEKTEKKSMAAGLTLFVKDGVSQCVVNIHRN